jgi:predicted metal-dependent phosphoesterase TrpH
MAVNIIRAKTDCKELRQVFQSIDAQSCPRTFNFHMHTTFSDGKLQPSEVMEKAIAIGLKGLAITDHHTVGGYQNAMDWLENYHWNNTDVELPLLWSGIEINANLLEIDVHILGYSFDIKHPSIHPYIQKKITRGAEYQAVNVINAIQEAGGIAVLAHPARYRKSHFDLIPAAVELGIDGVEAFYAYNNPNPWVPSVKETAQVEALAKEHGLMTTCGTDSHGHSLLLRLG